MNLHEFMMKSADDEEGVMNGAFIPSIASSPVADTPIGIRIDSATSPTRAASSIASTSLGTRSSGSSNLGEQSPELGLGNSNEILDRIEPIPAFASPVSHTSSNRVAGNLGKFRKRSLTCQPRSSPTGPMTRPRRIKRKFKNFTRTLSNENLVLFDDNVLLEHGAQMSVSMEGGGGSSSSFTESAKKASPGWCLYESLDYDQCENMVQLQEDQAAERKGLHRNVEITRTIVIFMIGTLTALTACFILLCVDQLSHFKYRKLMILLNKVTPESWTLFRPYALWLAFNGFPVLVGSVLVTYLAPVAAGSGIPVIKCYLNGVKVPEVVRIKTYFAKAIGVICSVTGGLACGKEGPMIHCGSVIGAGISQGKSTSFGFDFLRFLIPFREDHEKRDFVSAGAAAGVSAAFGSPLGGVMFSLEEGASFWNQRLVLRIFFCSLISSFVLNTVLSLISGQNLGSSGLLNFGKVEDLDYNFYEIPLYAVMGAFGGLTGALFNFLNKKLTILRMRYLRRGWMKVTEAVLISLMTATIGYTMIILMSECYASSTEETDFPVTFGCGPGQHNVMAALWFNTPEATLKNLFHNKDGTWNIRTLFAFMVVYFFISCVTYGLSVSSGLFIPGLLIGATWGRLFGLLMNQYFPGYQWVCSRKFALIGAAASLGGIVRMTISLTVILIETTGNLSFGLPIMITLFAAKWVGDYFTEGLYDIHIELSKVPFLDWEPPADGSRIYASELMHSPVVTLRSTETVANILEALQNTTHNGFPVVDADGAQMSAVRTHGRYRGLILRSQLLVMLQEKIFNQYSLNSPWKNLYHLLRDSYPRMPSLENIVNQLTVAERSFTMDLRPVMNPSAYTVSHAASLNRIFRLFRALGLRHLVVLNDYNEVIGIVTRKDLAQYCGIRL